MTRPESKLLTPADLDTDVYTLARQRTVEIMDNFDRVVVLFSGGKDSTAVLNVALDVARNDARFFRHLPLRVVFMDEEAIPQQTDEYVRRVSQRDDVAIEWWCLPLKHRNACSRHHPYWWTWAPEDRDKWCRPLPSEAITELAGFPIWPADERLTTIESNVLLGTPPHTTALLMGIRAEESFTRESAVRRKTIDNYIIKYTLDPASTRDKGIVDYGNLWKTYPIYDWTTQDVWAAVRIHGWDYNRAYNMMAMAGISPRLQRCSPAFGEEPLEKIHTYASCFPDVWARMCERVPGISAAYRYARTELYAYGSIPDKPADITWHDFLLHYIDKHHPSGKQHVARKLRQTIGQHYRTTSDPILVHSQHPETGVSWTFLLKAAMRGDYKNRRHAKQKIAGKDTQTLWRKYVNELASLINQGVTAHELGHVGALPTDPESLIPPHVRQQEEDVS